MRKLAWTCGGFCGAIFLAHYLLHARLLLFAAAAAVLAIAFGLTGKDALRRAVLCLFGAALGFSWYAVALRQIAPLADLPWEDRTVTARVSAYPTVYEDAVTLTLHLTSGDLAGHTARIYDYDGTTADLRPGDEVTAIVKLRTGALRFGKPTDAFLAKGVMLTGYLREPLKVTGVWSGKWLYFPQTLAHALVTRAAAVFPKDVSAFAQALMLGEKRDLYEQNLDIPLRNAGIMHAVAVSGMHLAFLLGFFQLLGGRTRRGALLTIPAVLVFVLMTGATPSVVRAALMSTLFILAPILERESDGPTSMLSALSALLAFNPFSAGSVSLQLSFAAIAGIALVSAKLQGRWLRAVRIPDCRFYDQLVRVRHYLVSTLATTIGALLFTLPLSAVHFGTVALAAPLTNLLVLWLLPYAFIACYGVVALSFAVPALGKLAAWLVAWALRYVLGVARVLGSLRALQLSAQDHRVVVWLAALYALFFLAWRLQKLPRWKYAAAGALSAALLVLAVSLTRAESLRTPRVSVLDVGQGQCLVLCAGAETVVVDCGSRASAENAGDIAAQYLCAQQRTQVDTLFLTHLHTDHANGVCRLLLQVPVRRIVVPASADPEGPELKPILALARERGVEVVFQAEDGTLACGALDTQIFAAVARDAEDGSLIYRFSYGDFDVLVTGDAPLGVEQALTAQAPLSDTELYIVGHHGSANASGDTLLDALGAETAIISCGYNTYGHPAEETLTRLQEHDLTIYRTDLDGTVTVRME